MQNPAPNTTLLPGILDGLSPPSMLGGNLAGASADKQRCPVRTVFLLILVAALLTGCAGGEKLPEPHGRLFALNPGLWQPTRADLHSTARIAGP